VARIRSEHRKLFGLQDTKIQRPTGDAFEDVLYGSESELDASDEEDASVPTGQQVKRKGEKGGARLRIDGDEPMDLLSGAATHITSTLLLWPKTICTHSY
jgi:ribosomal RNA-processing protein 12